jgi:general secretion pathway protein J
MIRNEGPSGFTLLELLVAVALLGLLLLGLAEANREGVAGWRAQSRRLARTAELDGVDRMLRLLVSSADPKRQPMVGGTDHRLVVNGSLPRSVAPARRAALMALTVTEDHRLVLQWRRPEAPAAPPESPPAEIELLDGVRALEIAYRSAGAGVWQRDWTDAAPPDLVRVHVAFEEGDPRDWPEIILAPIVTPGR